MTKKYRRVKFGLLPALETDVLPFELPITFSTLKLQEFLQSIGFKLESDNTFQVRSKLGPGEFEQLKILFAFSPNTSQFKPEKANPRISRQELSSVSRKGFAPRPLRYQVSNGAGKHRVLSLMHPRMMVELSYLFEEYADNILYYCNRSKFSLRHPVSKAKLASRIEDPFVGLDSSTISRFRTLEDEHVPSMFKYARFSNISSFYDSEEFRNCERRYSSLVKADISKCFDSIYTHSVSWAIHGIDSSKKMIGNRSERSIGGKFDKYFQRSNYNETNGICIGPETSRVFAEIILQEVDVLTAQSLEREPMSLVWGRDYEVFRYVDDYFIFASSDRIAAKILATLKSNLADYKLHINESKTELSELPLISGLSIAKSAVQESLTDFRFQDGPAEEPWDYKLTISMDAVVNSIKSAILTTGERFENLASYFMYCLEDTAIEASRGILALSEQLEQAQEDQKRELRQKAVHYFTAIVSLSLYAYSGLPTPNLSVRLCRTIVLAGKLFDQIGVPLVDTKMFTDMVRREISSQLDSIRDTNEFGVQTLNLIDCLTHLGVGLSSIEIADVIERRSMTVKQLDAIAVMVLLRACMNTSTEDPFRVELLEQVARIIGDNQRETEATILKLSIPRCPFLKQSEIIQALDLNEKQLLSLRTSATCSLFNWEIDEEYYEKLLLKSLQLVY